MKKNWKNDKHNNNKFIHSYILVTLIKSTYERFYAMYVEWTKFSEIENHSLFIQLLHAVETTRLRLCIKFVCIDCMLKNKCFNHFKLLQKLYFHHYSYCCWSTTRFICTRCWLQIFCKLCLSKELKNLINRAVTTRYAYIHRLSIASRCSQTTRSHD